MSIRRYFRRESLQHIFQRSVDYGNFLYTEEDNIVLISILYTYKRRYEIDILILCLMANHFHILLDSPDKKTMCQYMDVCTSLFARLYNKEYSRKGKLFFKSFGSASKSEEKKIRSCIGYIGNNPVEKKITASAAQYRWNLLPYYCNAYPFSNKIQKQSKRMRAALRRLEILHACNEYIGYQNLRELSYKLTAAEKRMLYDEIVSLYNPTNYRRVISFFGTFEHLITALNSNTGSEYDIKEEYLKISDSVYQSMVSKLREFGLWGDGKNPFTYTQGEKIIVRKILMEIPGVNNTHISKFLHIAL